MTLQQCIERYQAAHVIPIAERAVLTPKGDAALGASRLKAQIERLDAADRADLIAMLAQLVRELRRAERVVTVA